MLGNSHALGVLFYDAICSLGGGEDLAAREELDTHYLVQGIKYLSLHDCRDVVKHMVASKVHHDADQLEGDDIGPEFFQRSNDV